MANSSDFKTEQEAFWSGDFGDSYTDRNAGEALVRSYLFFWGEVLRLTGPVANCFEIGCNRGLNLDAIKTLMPACKTSGLEINSNAVNECDSRGHRVFEGSILAPPAAVGSSGTVDLSLVCGVLIHINPDSLGLAYELLYTLSNRFILISEYFNPVPVAIPYRGHEERLFKRDFAGEFWAQYPSLRLVDYGFVWRKDPVAPMDDTNWFLFEK
ncbi:pseudaminic acid biosynthesis-associated methylase [Synechococcus sp. AH-707-M23]|nr:pseudaminic acid biosynthesis-associated methylase [Synechococcus sp. AH-707-M23]